jgi:hypothetical protein
MPNDPIQEPAEPVVPVADELRNSTQLNRTQATWVSAWLISKGKPVKGGWLGVYQMRIDDISKRYHVKPEEVIKAARGEYR